MQCSPFAADSCGCLRHFAVANALFQCWPNAIVQVVACPLPREPVSVLAYTLQIEQLLSKAPEAPVPSAFCGATRVVTFLTLTYQTPVQAHTLHTRSPRALGL
jgi:hypothetical protein